MIISLEVLTKVIADGKFEGLLLGAWLGSLDGLDIGTYDDNSLWFWNGKTLVTILGAMDGLPISTYDST